MDSLANLGPNTRVERGLTVITPGQTTIEIIPAVNMVNAFVVSSCANGAGSMNSSGSPHAITAYARLISSTEVEIKGGARIGALNSRDVEISWEVITND